MERDISYGELAELAAMFEAATSGHVFDCEEAREECEFDYIQQYIDGCDEPEPYYRNF